MCECVEVVVVECACDACGVWGVGGFGCSCVYVWLVRVVRMCEYVDMDVVVVRGVRVRVCVRVCACARVRV